MHTMDYHTTPSLEETFQVANRYRREAVGIERILQKPTHPVLVDVNY